MPTAHAGLTRSLACSRALHERTLVAHALAISPDGTFTGERLARPGPLLREALTLARAAGDQLGLAGTLMFQALAAAGEGGTRRAWVLNRAGLAAARQVGDRWLIAALLLQLGSQAIDTGEVHSALPLLEEGLEVSRALGVPTRVGQFQWRLGRIALMQGELDRALPLLEALRLRDAVSDRPGSVECLELLAAVDADVESLHAAWLLGAAAAARRALGAPPSPLLHQEPAVTTRTAQAAVSTAAFEIAQARGALVSLEKAILRAWQDHLSLSQHNGHSGDRVQPNHVSASIQK